MNDIIDTSRMRELMICAAPEQLRKGGEVPPAMLATIGRLLLGLPVHRSEIDAFGLRVIRCYEMDELGEALGRGELTGVPLLPNNVTPLKR